MRPPATTALASPQIRRDRRAGHRASLGALCSYTEKYLTTSVGQWVMHDLRRTLYSHVQRLSLSYHDHKQTGDLISRVTSDIDAIQSFIASGLLGALVDSLTLVGMVGVMFYINWRFTLIALSVAPVLFVVVYTYTRRIKKASREVRKKEGEIVSVIQEVLTSIRVVKAFAREDYEQRRLEEESLESVEIALRARGLKAKLSPLVEIIVAVGTCLVLWFGARMVLCGRPLARLADRVHLLPGQNVQADAGSVQDDGRLLEGLGRLRAHSRGAGNRPRSGRPAGRAQGPALPRADRIRARRASPTSRATRSCTTSTCASSPDRLAALVGPTGAGKTTIVSLIPRFYDPASGVVKIDGTDVRRFTQKSLREQISFVLQDTVLFHAPIWHNIAYGKPGASRAEILRAAEIANASEFIEKLPNGYDTVVGERGVTLSGGQRQRIAIARAVIRNSPILILDEPSTGLDAGSEKLVFEALDRLMEGRTSIVIAHRLSTIRRADCIFVVKDGTIVEHGRHEELLRGNGLYAELAEIQLQQEQEVTGQ